MRRSAGSTLRVRSAPYPRGGSPPMPWKMETIYLGCAAIGGTILVLQTILLLFGGGDHDADAVHVDTSDIGASNSGEAHTQDTGFGLFSVRTIASFLTFFGLGGWAG